MRNNFINSLFELALIHEDIFIICGDLGYSVLEQFSKQFPHRFLNAGIAEQNMTQVAVGLAREGFNVFTYSIGNFPTLRCMEQIRYDLCYHGANVKIVSVGAGYAYGSQGVSHHTTEDISMMRSIPEMIVCSPADSLEAKLAADFMAKYKGPGYVRLNKSGEPNLHNTDNPIEFKPGKFIPVKDGVGTLILATGAIAHPTLMEMVDFRRDWALWSSPFIGNYDKKLMVDIGERFENIITIEEHQANGGFGSSIVETFSDMYDNGCIKNMPKIRRIAIPNVFISVSGTQEYLRKSAGLSLKQIN